MKYRKLGSSGLRVSTISMGTMTFGGVGGFKPVGSTDVAAAKRQLAMCIDAGVNLVDTANIYSGGAAEEILGQAIVGRRHELLIASKVGLRTGDGPNGAGSSRGYIIDECEKSLHRLGTDYIDLYQLHCWDGSTALEETLAALDDLMAAGKIRYIGCSNFSGWHLMKALGISDRHHLPRFVSHQIHYSLQAREAEYELLPIAIDQDLGTLVWSPLAGGLLSGKYRRGHEGPAGSRHMSGWTEPPIYDEERLHDIIEVVVSVADKRGAKPAQVALAYLLSRPWVTSLVVGARTDEQLLDNIGAADLELDPAELEELDTVSTPSLIYPYWHQANSLRERVTPADIVLAGPRRAKGDGA